VGEIKPGIPDIIEPLTLEMMKLGIAYKMIADFRQLWSQLEPHSKLLPCPICFAKSYVGKLVALPADPYGNESVRCDTCNASIVVRQVN
jgi:hypothetical protein